MMVELSGNTGRLLIDGKEVGRNDNMTLNPDDVGATMCCLGRSKKGDYFKGRIDKFEIYSIPATD